MFAKDCQKEFSDKLSYIFEKCIVFSYFPNLHTTFSKLDKIRNSPLLEALVPYKVCEVSKIS